MITENQKTALLKKIRDLFPPPTEPRRAGDRYPPQLRILCREARASGIEVHEIQQASSVRLETLCKWIGRGTTSKESRRRHFKRLKIVQRPRPPKLPDRPYAQGCFVFPSGVRLEIAVADLSSAFLSHLGVLQ
jgi:hypothetical protein